MKTSAIGEKKYAATLATALSAFEVTGFRETGINRTAGGAQVSTHSVQNHSRSEQARYGSDLPNNSAVSVAVQLRGALGQQRKGLAGGRTQCICRPALDPEPVLKPRIGICF